MKTTGIEHVTDAKPEKSPARILSIAGSDSGGGAGIQADIKAITMNGGFAMTAVTAITVQNTQGVYGVIPVPQDAIAGQIKVTLSDIGADVIKTGMLGDRKTIETVSGILNEFAAEDDINDGTSETGRQFLLTLGANF